MNNSDMWVLLWSQRQNATHIELLETALSSGRQAYCENRPTDYVALFVGPEHEVRAAADHIRPTMQARDRGMPKAA